MKGRGGLGAAGTLIAACLFGAALLLSLAAGAGVYRQVQRRTEESAETRLGLSYLTAKVHAYDAAGGVRAGEFGGATALYLLEELDGVGYETILYVYDGYLRELFCEQGWELEPTDGEPIAEARRLTVSQRDRLLTLDYVDGGGTEARSDIWIRSGGSEWKIG